MAKDMLTVPRDLLQDLTDDVADYAVSRTFKDRETTWRSDLLKRARALLACQPAAIDKQEAKACPECGGSLTTWKCLCDPIWPGYTAPLANEASKPAPSVEQDDPTDYEALEREHLGDAEKRTGIYAPSVEQDERGDCDARIRKWRDQFDVMHRRAMNAEANVRELVSQARAASTSTVEQVEFRAIVPSAEQWEELRLLARTYNATGFPKYANEWQARAASTSANVAQGEKRDAKSDRYFLVVENGSYLIVDRERREMRGDEPDYFVLAWTPNKDDAKFVCDVMNESREF